MEGGKQLPGTTCELTSRGRRRPRVRSCEEARGRAGPGRTVRRALPREEGGAGTGGPRAGLTAAPRRHGNPGRPPGGCALRWQRKSRLLAAPAGGRRGRKEGRGLVEAQVGQGAAAAFGARPAPLRLRESPVVWHVSPLPRPAAAAAATGGGREPAAARERGQEP